MRTILAPTIPRFAKVPLHARTLSGKKPVWLMATVAKTRWMRGVLRNKERPLHNVDPLAPYSDPTAPAASTNSKGYASPLFTKLA